MPPRMLPTATPVFPEAAALTVIAISGRLVAIASRTSPPSADPRCSRVASTSVWSDSCTPATQMRAAAPAKIATRAMRGRPDTRLLDVTIGVRQVSRCGAGTATDPVTPEGSAGAAGRVLLAHGGGGRLAEGPQADDRLL